MLRQRHSRIASSGLRHRPGRRGAAAVEFAICLPFLLVLALGAIETSNVMYLRTRMNSAAYEGARTATRPTTAAKTDATTTDVSTRCTALLNQLGVQGGQVQVQVVDYLTSQSKTLSTANPQDLVTVTVTAPLNQNCITTFVVSSSITITAQATLVVE